MTAFAIPNSLMDASVREGLYAVGLRGGAVFVFRKAKILSDSPYVTIEFALRAPTGVPYREALIGHHELNDYEINLRDVSWALTLK